MRRMIVVVLLLSFSSQLIAADKTKRELIGELLELVDTKAMTQELLRTWLERNNSAQENYLAELSDEHRTEVAAHQQQYREKQAKVQQAVLLRLDYDKIALELYAPLYEKTFSANELEQLIAFHKTPVGKKHAALLPELAFSATMNMMALLGDEFEEVELEIAREEQAKQPDWRRTLSDIRSVATASEAYAVDNERYPDARNMSELSKLIEPTYIRKTPLKDAWGNEFVYVVSDDKQHYRFVSAGSDGKFEWDSGRIEKIGDDFKGMATDDPAADIVYQDGHLVRFPREAQTEE